MSSSAFCCQLIPERRQRRLPLACGVAAAVIGSTMLLHTALALPLRLPLALAWAIWCGVEIARQATISAGLRRLRLCSDGSVSGRRPGGQWVALTLLPGSVVLRRHAWLRLRTPAGRDYGEYVTGSPAVAGNWHRLQLIWRQRSAAFGHT